MGEWVVLLVALVGARPRETGPVSDSQHPEAERGLESGHGDGERETESEFLH